MYDIHLRKKHTGTGEVISGKTVQIFKIEIIFQNEDISFGYLKTIERSKSFSIVSKKVEHVE